MKVGVLKETRRWEDRRVAVTPETAMLIKENYPDIELYIQSSSERIHSDDEYRKLGIPVVDDLSHCDILIGVKEVAGDALIEGKTHLMFAHVAKKQAFNKQFIQEMVQKKITLIDHEYLTNIENTRLVFFGFWAGVVGAYYAFKGAAKRFTGIKLLAPEKCTDLNDLYRQLKRFDLPPLKILVTGGGRVASGALEIIRELNVEEVLPHDFLNKKYDHAVYTRLNPDDYVMRNEGEFDRMHFYKNPHDYKSSFKPYLSATDVFIACHFWDHQSPHFFTQEELQSDDFSISLIADVSCDVPGPIPTTIRTSSIKMPYYDIDPKDLSEKPAFSSPEYITVMAVDNLPSALPVDASHSFARDLYYQVLPSLFGEDSDGIIQRATILKDGELTAQYSYLSEFIKGE